MSYQKLKKQAEELGISPHGKSIAQLEKEIDLVLKSDLNESEQEKLDKIKEERDKKIAKKAEEKKKKFNTIIVYSGKMEVRRYTKELHGEDFVNLAMEFADSRGYGVEAVNREAQIECPSCGHCFPVRA